MVNMNGSVREGKVNVNKVKVNKDNEQSLKIIWDIQVLFEYLSNAVKSTVKYFEKRRIK